MRSRAIRESKPALVLTSCYRSMEPLVRNSRLERLGPFVGGVYGVLSITRDAKEEHQKVPSSIPSNPSAQGLMLKCKVRKLMEQKKNVGINLEHEAQH